MDWSCHVCFTERVAIWSRPAFRLSMPSVKTSKGAGETPATTTPPPGSDPAALGSAAAGTALPAKPRSQRLGLSALKLLWGDGHDSQVLDPATPPAAENAQIPTMFPSTLFSLAPFTANPRKSSGPCACPLIPCLPVIRLPDLGRKRLDKNISEGYNLFRHSENRMVLLPKW